MKLQTFQKLHYFGDSELSSFVRSGKVYNRNIFVTDCNQARDPTDRSAASDENNIQNKNDENVIFFEL